MRSALHRRCRHPYGYELGGIGREIHGSGSGRPGELPFQHRRTGNFVHQLAFGGEELGEQALRVRNAVCGYGDRLFEQGREGRASVYCRTKREWTFIVVIDEVLECAGLAAVGESLQLDGAEVSLALAGRHQPRR